MKVLVSLGNDHASEAYKFDKGKKLDSHIKAVHKLLGPPEPAEKYGLFLVQGGYFLSPKDYKNSAFYLPDNCHLLLKLSPKFEAESALEKLDVKAPVTTRRMAIFQLKKQLEDPLFAVEFIKLNGVAAIMVMIEESQGNTLSYGLLALQQSMAYGSGNFLMTESLCVKLVSLLRMQNINVAKSALKILTSMTNTDRGLMRTQKALTAVDPSTEAAADNCAYGALLVTLRSTDLNLQTNTLELINSLVQHAKTMEMKADLIDTFTSSEFLEVLQKVVQSEEDDVLQALLRLQTSILDRQSEGKAVAYDKNNASHEALLNSLWTTTFPDTQLESRINDQWGNLGFQGKDPATDFRGMGLLGLQHLLYFANTHTDIFRGMVMKQCERTDEKEYPLAVAGINISQMLLGFLGCGASLASSTDLGQQTTRRHSSTSAPEVVRMEPEIRPILFDCPHAVEELYCVALRTLDLKWEEMDAAYMQFPMVLDAVKAVVTDALETCSTLDQFQEACLIGAGGSGGASENGAGSGHGGKGGDQAMESLREENKKLTRKLKQMEKKLKRAEKRAEVAEEKVRVLEGTKKTQRRLVRAGTKVTERPHTHDTSD
eukprot:TRINITY_DN4689_c0_g1_i1.p1 TRINITY_DN4689_c0_g1~~TRINITY_DN4689_c0_g1_i1.p1  ORF type:complete len:600 (+),score=138.77 TRINITY_DN4689_c0_g1_i1:570-2369(+)